MCLVRFKFRCNNLFSGKIIKEMPGSVASGTPCTSQVPSTCPYHYLHSIASNTANADPLRPTLSTQACSRAVSFDEFDAAVEFVFDFWRHIGILKI